MDSQKGSRIMTLRVKISAGRRAGTSSWPTLIAWPSGSNLNIVTLRPRVPGIMTLLVKFSRWNEQLAYVYDPAGNLSYRTNNALVENFQSIL